MRGGGSGCGGLETRPQGRHARAVQLGQVSDPALREAVGRWAAALGRMTRADRMAVLDLALPALDALPRDAAAELALQLRALVAADGATTVFEWAVLRIVSRRLARAAGAARAVPVTARTAGDVEVELLDLLSVLAWAGARDEAAARAALESATAVLGLTGWRVLPRGRVDGRRFEAALQRLEGASPRLKASVVEACAASVLADGVVVPAEGELVRAIAATLGVPVPPLLGAVAAAAGAASTA